MTTVADPWIHTIPTIRDRESLKLVERLVESQLTMAEAQVAQLHQAKELLEKQRGLIG
jgi:hypothetical protein